MKLVIILNEPYPFGMACTNRLHLYAKGLISSGVDVKIIVPKPKLTSKKVEVMTSSTYDGVPYEYSSNSPYRSNSFFKRRIIDTFSPIKAAKKCIKEKPDSILIVGGILYYVLIFKFVSKITKSRLLREKSEIPYMERDSLSGFKRIYLKATFSLFDGIITITDELARFFVNDLNLKIETCTIPILIEEQEMSIDQDPSDDGDYILYTGSLIDRKDGILTILDAFAKVLVDFSNLRLVITGNAKSSPDYQKVQQKIQQLGIHENISFTGFISKSRLNTLMQNARLLVLVKPENRQNRYNFPTKIGEYLVSGAPVLCTENPTINSYFKDYENMFICENVTNKIAEKVIYVLKNPLEAKKVAEKGKLLAEQQFNYLIQMKRLKEFI